MKYWKETDAGNVAQCPSPTTSAESGPLLGTALFDTDATIRPECAALLDKAAFGRRILPAAERT